MKTRTFLTICFALFLFVQSVLSQSKLTQTNQIQQLATPESTPDWITFKDNVVVNPYTLFQDHQSAFNLSHNDEMRLSDSVKDELGFTHYHYQQYYKGIRVEDGAYIIHSNNGNRVYSANGKLTTGLDIKVAPSLTPAEAIKFALTSVNDKEYRWQSLYWEKLLQEKTGNPQASYYPVPELVIYQPFLPNGKETTGGVVAYRVDVYGSTSQRIYIDANNGELLGSVPLESNCSSASVATIFNGSRSVNSAWSWFNNTYILHDDCQTATIKIKDWNSSTATASPLEVTSANNTWATTNQRFGGTVQWSIKQAYNYFLNVHSRNSYDNDNGDIEAYINAMFTYNNGNCCTRDNASMSFSGGIMKVGLGSSGTLSNSWSALDIIGHEYAHAVTGSSAQLNYNGESGALNESFSDIFGEMVELYTTGNNDWLMGNERTDKAIRNMSNPKTKHQPSTYQSDYWYSGTEDYGGVHTNSSVQNLWFYLLSNGGSGTNDNGFDYTVIGIGATKARAIAYRNLTTYLVSSSTYGDAKLGSINAAIDLFGGGSAEVSSVIKAWCAVGLGTSCSSSPTVTNDNCANAVSITPNTTCTSIQGTVLNATASGLSKASCDAYTGAAHLQDVWYAFTAATNGTYIITASPLSSSTSNTNIDIVLSLYKGSCGSLSQVSGGCADVGGGPGVQETITTTLNAGTYWIRVYDYGSVAPTTGGFSICVTSPITCNPITVSSWPTDQAIQAAPTSCSFNVTASGTDILYRWEYSVNNGSTWATVPGNSTYSGVNSPTLTINSTTNSMNGYKYRCSLKNNCQIEFWTNWVTLSILTDVANDEHRSIPTDYSLLQNYPNPFNPATTIAYIVPKGGFVSLTVFDILGSKVATLTHDYKSAGKYEVVFDATSLPNGTYFYRLSAGEFMQVKKCILMK